MQKNKILGPNVLKELPPEAQSRYHTMLAIVWDGTDEQLPEAETLVHRLCTINGWKPPVHVRKMIKLYHSRLETEGSPVTHYHNAGRPATITPEQTRLVLTELLSYKAHGRSYPYSSIQQLAMYREPVKTVLSETGISIEGLIKHLHKAMPTLKYVKLLPKKKLTQKIKERRLVFSRDAVRQTNDELMATVQIDAKGMPMVIGSMRGWVDTADETWAAEVSIPQMRKMKCLWLFYYIAVCGCAGPVLLYFTTGTTGQEACRDGITFKVGGQAAKCAGASPAITCDTACCTALVHLAERSCAFPSSNHSIVKPAARAAEAYVASTIAEFLPLLS